MLFKENLSARRKELNLTQKELAKKLNVSDKTISKWENGGSYPDLPILIELSKVLEIELKELLEEQQQENSYENIINNEKINKFKLKSLISMGLVLFSFIIYFNMNSELFISLFVLSIIFSIIIFIYNNITFYLFYNDKHNTKEYDLLYFKFSQILLHMYSLLCWTIIIENFRSIFGINGIQLKKLLIVVLLTLIMGIISAYILPKIQKKSGIKICNDRKTKIIKIILIIFVILTFLALAISFIIHYLVMEGYPYPIPLLYRSFLLITYILYMIFLNKNKYFKE